MRNKDREADSSIDWAHAAQLFREVEQSFGGRRRPGDVSRAAVAAAYAKALQRNEIPSLQQIHAGADIQKPFDAVQAALRTAIADVGERLALIQGDDPPEEDAPFLVLRSNGALRRGIWPNKTSATTIPLQLLELLHERQTARFEELMALLAGREAAANPPLQSWRDVFGHHLEPLTQLTGTREVEVIKRIAGTILGQGIAIAVALYKPPPGSDTKELLACAVHVAKHRRQPPTMWLQSSPLARMLRLAYRLPGVTVKRVVFVDRITLHLHRYDLENYLDMLHGGGVKQVVCPLPDDTPPPSDYLILPKSRVFEYQTGPNAESDYPFSTEYMWGTADSNRIAELTAQFHESWRQGAEITVEQNADRALDMISTRLKASSRDDADVREDARG